ncbi:hypothetical protein HID58_041330, partial [Brassica napus]
NTTCEVFDFGTSLWRYIHPASPCRINVHHDPVYLDGSLYWFTACRLDKELVNILHIGYFLNRYGNILTELEIIVYSLIACEKTKVLSFDLHTETFQVICKSPFVHAHDDPYSISICILDNCLVYAKLTGPPKI